MSHETTFDRDLHAVRDRAELGTIFTQLCELLAADLSRKGYLSQTIGIKLRFDDFKSVTRDLTLPEPTADAPTIRRAAGECLKRVDLTRRLRLLGVRGGKLMTPGEWAARQVQAAARARAKPRPAAATATVQEPEPAYNLPLFEPPPDGQA